MPYVDYNEWYRREQDRIARTKGAKPIGTGGYEPYQGYQAPRFGQIDREMGQYTADVGKAAAKGFVAGGPAGAAIAGAIAAAPQMARSGRRAWDAAKAGDYEGVSRSLAPISPVFYVQAKMGGDNLLEKMGAPSWTNPMKVGTKIIAELFGGPQTRIEEKRWERLKQAGFDVPKWVEEGKDIKDSGFRQDLAPDFVGKDAEGNWVNNIFAKSRNEADLTAEDVNQYAVMPETFGTLWRDSNEQAKTQVANLARENNLLREYKGTLDVNWTPELMRRAQDILANSVAQNPEQAKRMRWSPLKKNEGWQPLR